MTQPASKGGVDFPSAGSGRSSTASGRAVISAATRQVDTAASTYAAAETNWRKAYTDHFRTLTRLEANQHAQRIAQTGLAFVHEHFVFTRGHDSMPLDVAVNLPHASGVELHTVQVRGRAAATSADLSVPYRGDGLSGAALSSQLDRWAAVGTVEPSFTAALHAVQDNSGWLDLSDLTVVVLGAGAELAPLLSLLRWGARVVAVDRPRPDLWARLIAVARESPGTLVFPLRIDPSRAGDDAALAANAGADLVTELPEVAAWLSTFDTPFTLASYVYADGAEHVRVSVAVDALTRRLLATRQDIALAFLATPTDCYAVPAEVVQFAHERFQKRSGWSVAAHSLSAGRAFAEHFPSLSVSSDGDRFGICDALVEQQGPNYALAKRIQRWRATSARLTGTLVSTTVAPATRTRSVMRNRLLAAAYAGAPRFGLEVFNPSTSNTVMAAMLVHDLRCSTSTAQPTVPLAEAYRLFVDGAAHGGMWRTGYAPRSVLGAAVLLGMFSRS